MRIRALADSMIDQMVDQVLACGLQREAELVDRLIAVLDEWDGEVDAEDGGDFEVSEVRPFEADHTHI